MISDRPGTSSLYFASNLPKASIRPKTGTQSHDSGARKHSTACYQACVSPLCKQNRGGPAVPHVRSERRGLKTRKKTDVAGNFRAKTRARPGRKAQDCPQPHWSSLAHRPLRLPATPAAAAQSLREPTAATYCCLLPLRSPLPALARRPLMPSNSACGWGLGRFWGGWVFVLWRVGRMEGTDGARVRWAIDHPNAHLVICRRSRTDAQRQTGGQTCRSKSRAAPGQAAAPASRPWRPPSWTAPSTPS
jgi:hypothetical protein